MEVDEGDGGDAVLGAHAVPDQRAQCQGDQWRDIPFGSALVVAFRGIGSERRQGAPEEGAGTEITPAVCHGKARRQRGTRQDLSRGGRSLHCHRCRGSGSGDQQLPV